MLFTNHTILISYSLWKGNGEIKTFANIFGVERRTHFKLPTIKEYTKTHVWSKNHGNRGSCVCKLFKVFQLYTSQMYSVYPNSLIGYGQIVNPSLITY